MDWTAGLKAYYESSSVVSKVSKHDKYKGLYKV